MLSINKSVSILLRATTVVAVETISIKRRRRLAQSFFTTIQLAADIRPSFERNPATEERNFVRNLKIKRLKLWSPTNVIPGVFLTEKVA